MTSNNTAQQRFDAAYITSTEITQRLRVTRPTISQAKQRGILPDAIMINDNTLAIWERGAIEPHLAAWEQALNFKRGSAQNDK